MKFKCLVLDYDNTLVATVPELQYPALKYAYEANGFSGCPDLKDYLAIDFEVGIREYIKTDHPDVWEKMTNDFINHIFSSRSPPYEGLKDILFKFAQAGGELFVASNSDVAIIESFWHYNGLPEISGIFGWNMGREYRKPNSKSLEDILKITKFEKKNVLVLDDRESGVEMAKSLGIRSAVAGWGLVYEKGFEWMKNNSGADYFLSEVSELETLLFGD